MSGLPARQGVQDAMTALVRARAFLDSGDVDQAEAVFAEMALGPPGVESGEIRFARLDTLGEIYRKQGKLHLAAAIYHPLLDVVEAQPLEPPIVHFHIELSRLYYEWNWLEKAQQLLQRCLALVQRNDLQCIWSVQGHLALAWNRWAAGSAQAAYEEVETAGLIARSSVDEQCRKHVNAHRARLSLRLGDFHAASSQLHQAGLDAEAPAAYQHQYEYLTLARLWVVQGRAKDALALLESLYQTALRAGRNGDVAEMLGLQALAYQAQGDIAGASAALANALCRGEREGFIRTFLDEGAPMAGLLHRAAAQGVTLIYVHELLNAFDRSHIKVRPDPRQATDGLVEPLSRREIEVLQLAASGRTNEEIACQLCISLTTVKKHLSNTFGKLGVKNRTKAGAKARELYLIE
jgi:LuxR family maltose regulon positive regulatory protein